MASLVAAFLVILVCALMPGDACKVDFEKVGCYKDTINRRLPQLLVTSRDSTSPQYLGEKFNWTDFHGSVRKLLCKCSAVARGVGFRYIGIQYYAECWGGKSESKEYAKDGPSPNCMQSIATFGQEVCNFDLQTDCVGMGWANFVYKLLDCSEMIDIVVLFDVSPSMQGEALETGKDFLKNLVERLKISRQGTHIGLITFSDTARVEFDFKSPLNNGENSEELKTRIEGIKSSGGRTLPEKALILAGQSHFTEAGGARHEVPRFLITITDGTIHQSSVIYPTMYYLQNNEHVNLLSVGVGPAYIASEVKVLALNKQENTFNDTLGDAAEKVYHRLTSLAQVECDSHN